MVEDGRAVGVDLSDGEEVRADRIVSWLSPKTTLLTQIGARYLDAGLVTRARPLKARALAAKLHLALRGLPDFRGANVKDRLVIAPSEHHVEAAFNPVKYGAAVGEPVMEMGIPTAHDASVAPDGHHLQSATVQFAPRAPADPVAARAAMLAASLKVLEDYALRIVAPVRRAELLMPFDIQTCWRLEEGVWHHGELSAEQDP